MPDERFLERNTCRVWRKQLLPEVIFVFSFIISNDKNSILFVVYFMCDIYNKLDGNRGDARSRVNSFHRFAGFFSVPPRRSIYWQTKSKPRL
jgi:hypothetical protein